MYLDSNNRVGNKEIITNDQMDLYRKLRYIKNGGAKYVSVAAVGTFELRSLKGGIPSKPSQLH